MLVLWKLLFYLDLSLLIELRALPSFPTILYIVQLAFLPLVRLQIDLFNLLYPPLPFTL